MQLGALIRRLEDETDAAHAMEVLGDVILFSRVQEMGRRHGETPGDYLAGAARRFTSQGGDDDWLALMTAIERSDDPARAAIVKMLGWALARDSETPLAQGCGCGSNPGGRHDVG